MSAVVSIITIVRNGRDDIERTIRSVLSQEYPSIEYTVVDGASADGTLDIIRRYENRLANFVSEPDAGISDAWNKGLALAGGNIIGLLNAGDEYAPDAVSQAVLAIRRGADLVYGDTDLVDNVGSVVRRNRGRFSLWRFSGGLGFYHPSVFARKSMYDKLGGFDTRLKFAMDADWVVRARATGARIEHADIKVKMLDGGVSVNNKYSAYGEYLQILRRNDVSDTTIHLSMMSTALRGLVRNILK